VLPWVVEQPPAAAGHLEQQVHVLGFERAPVGQAVQGVGEEANLLWVHPEGYALLGQEPDFAGDLVRLPPEGAQ
jgi:hypothetical protein